MDNTKKLHLPQFICTMALTDLARGSSTVDDDVTGKLKELVGYPLMVEDAKPLGWSAFQQQYTATRTTAATRT